MRITSITISNFKSIRRLHLAEIPNLVVLAGPNGSGKTAMFDAIRIFKEANAGYSVRAPGQSQAYGLVQNLGPVVTVGQPTATIEMSFAVLNAERLLLGLPEGHTGELSGRVYIQAPAAPGQPETFTVDGGFPGYAHLRQLLGERYLTGGPLGLLDHIGPDRRFTPTQIGGINFSLDYQEAELQALVFNSEAKFANLAQDLIMMRLLDMQERERNHPNPHNYIEGVRDIFRHFLPDKEFLDVDIPEGFSGPPRLLVRSGGVEHTINQLSSGQREILMTYTHLEKLRPTGSIILFDEPELHLHPTLQRRVIAHLQRLLERGNNQIFVVTHSEEIVGTADYATLYAMTGTGEPAVMPVIDRAARLDLLESLGASVGVQLTSPRILFLEGETDALILPLFFDVLPSGLSLVDTGGKGKMMRLVPSAMAVLEEAVRDGQLYMVRDLDVEDDPEALTRIQNTYAGHFFVWDRYHIENYLLDEVAIYHVLADDPDVPTPLSPESVVATLQPIANERKDDVLAKHIEAYFDRRLRKRLRLNVSEGVEQSLRKAAEARLNRMTELLNSQAVTTAYTTVVSDLDAKWETEWKNLCIGRDVLQAYHAAHVAPHLGYDSFRNKIARKICELGRVPTAITTVMVNVLDGLSSGVPSNEASNPNDTPPSGVDSAA
jgi:hypothetical protein